MEPTAISEMKERRLSGSNFECGDEEFTDEAFMAEREHGFSSENV